MSNGAGHDFSFGLMWDDRGVDKYSTGGLSLGAGNANGIGLFADMEGDDTYATTGADGLGRARSVVEGSLRTRAFSMGLFIDGYGNDSYPARTAWARNGNADISNPNTNIPRKESQIGVFLDR